MNSDGIPPARLANKAELAEWFDVSIPAINAWVRRGCPYIQPGNKTTPWVFDVLAVHQWLANRDAEACAPVPTHPDGMTPLDRKWWYESEKIKREIEERMRNLITAEEYQREKARILGHLIPFAEALPDRLAHMLPPDALAVAREECDALAQWLRSEIPGTNSSPPSASASRVC